MRFTTRLTIAILLVAAVHATFWITQSGSTPNHVLFPKPDLRQLPMQLGDWRGEPIEISSRIFKATGGEYVVNRAYRRSDGRVVTAHIVVIVNYGAKGVHHFPQYCYRGSGYRPIRSERKQVQVAGGEMPVDYSLWGRDDGAVAVAYWYHFGDDVIFDIDEFRRASRRRWGSHVWPPCVKVLLQTTADNPNRIPDHLEEFTRLVAERTIEASNPSE